MLEKTIKKSLENTIKKYKGGAVIMMELPTESYFEATSTSVKILTGGGFDGIYISFQRPFKNIFSLLTQQGINVERLLFIDVATALGELLGEGLSRKMQEKDSRCIHISPDINVDELIRAIYISLSRLKSEKRFIFIDSLTTIALYKPLSETMRFFEFLIRTIRKHDVQNVSIIFNVAKDLAQKKFIKDVAISVDKVISVVE